MEKRDPIRVYDARWIEGEFNDSEITRLCESVILYAREINVDTITVTRDSRLAAGDLMEKTVDIAKSNGFNVFLCTKPISTPQSYFFSLSTTLTHPNTMGITITASHNPPKHIGIKITVPQVRAIGYNTGPKGGFKRIREIYYSNKKLKYNKNGKLILRSPTEEFIDFSMNYAEVPPDSLAGITVVLDSFNGAAGPEIYSTMERAGVTVIPLKLIPDGRFPYGTPNPIGKNKMKPALQIAQKIENSVVIGTDGDGDRLVFGNRSGILTSGFASLPILEMLPKGKKNTASPIIYDPKVNPLIIKRWEKMNLSPRPFRNGHSQIKEYMRDIGAIAAVEESGHFYHKLPYRDIILYGENSLVTILLFLKAILRNLKLIDDLLTQQNQTFSTGEINYQFENNNVRDMAIESVIRHFKSKGAIVQSTTEDGIDLQGYLVTNTTSNDHEGENWYSGYFRVSTNEEGIFRSYLTASDSAMGKKLEKEIRKINLSLNGKESE